MNTADQDQQQQRRVTTPAAPALSTSTSQTQRPKPDLLLLPKQLSAVSKKYDGDGKGYLSNNERALRTKNDELTESARSFFLRQLRDLSGKLDPDDLLAFVERHNELRGDNEGLRISQAKLRGDNRKLRRNQILLGIATIALGITAIVSAIAAVEATKDTVVVVATAVGGGGGSAAATLASKDTGSAVVTRGRGISIVSELLVRPADGGGDVVVVECVRAEDAAALYRAFGEGAKELRILTNDSAVFAAAATTGIVDRDHEYNGDNDDDDDGPSALLPSSTTTTIGFPVRTVRGATAWINDTHVVVGDVAFDMSANNPCNNNDDDNSPPTIDDDSPTRRKLFSDHLHGITPTGGSFRARLSSAS